MNKGEEVIRGPLKIHEAVDVVTTKQRTFHAVPVHELPVAAPYKATKEQLQEWLVYVQGWMEEHRRKNRSLKFPVDRTKNEWYNTAHNSREGKALTGNSRYLRIYREKMDGANLHGMDTEAAPEQ